MEKKDKSAKKLAKKKAKKLAKKNGMRALKLLNDYVVSSSHNLAPYAWNKELHKLAQKYTDDMLKGKVAFSQDGFKMRAKQISFPVLNFAEMAAYNYGQSDPVADAVKQWLDSPDQRKKLKYGGNNEAGIGVSCADSKCYFSALLERPL